MLLKLVSASTASLVSDLQQHLRLDSPDPLLDSYALAAVSLAEEETGCDFLEKTWDYFDRRFYSVKIQLPRVPVQSVTWIKYYLGSTLTTLDPDDYRLCNPHKHLAWVEPVTTWPVYCNSWPRSDEVQIRFVSGHSQTPEILKHFVRMTVGNWWENREATISGTIINEIPLGAQRLLDQLKLWGVA